MRLFSKGLIFAVIKPVSGPRGLSKQNTMSYSLKSRAGNRNKQDTCFCFRSVVEGRYR